MSNQNKFRVWSPSENKYLVEPRLALSLLNPAPFVGTIVSFDGDIEWFSGLLDKNGKEIYEGDIVKEISVATPQAYAYADPLTVVFKGGRFNLDYGIPGVYSNCYTEYEVIGNIHENC